MAMGMEGCPSNEDFQQALDFNMQIESLGLRTEVEWLDQSAFTVSCGSVFLAFHEIMSSN